ncbi:aldo/keto reductase [Georgenia yuyongxinii]|uniref:Aldo/keto reductase n=1 Tax=Georgenia yuyongxinii TaxID=2589797 RepID=A0A552WWB6_9MICO|nr:aldo/keto reductase [Georgenia yuyongxinii]TRW47015.1 aldo/keto reductase [Georgenia yuyongxinii]
MGQVPQVTLNDGNAIPQLGLGVFQVPPEDTERVVTEALAAGYRSIDTAARYGNEHGVGAAVATSGLDRDEVFVATKLANPDQGYASTLTAFDASARELGLDVVDLYLIHWPAPARKEFLNSWRAMEELRAAGRVRSIGVSNFLVHHLEEVLNTSGVVPAVNQIELHPYLQQRELRAFHADHGIVTEAYSPLGRGGVLADPVITGIAERLGRTPAQVVLRWHLQLGNVVIPKSVHAARMAENLDLGGPELSEDDMTAIASLDRGGRTGFHPDRFNGFPEDFAEATQPVA